MDLAIVVYLIGLFSTISIVSEGVLFLLSILTIAALLFLPIFIEEKDKLLLVKNYYIKSLKYLGIPAILFLVIIPSKTDMYIMTGLVVGEKIITSEKGNELLDKSYLYIIDKIDTAISENAEIEEVEEDAK